MITGRHITKIISGIMAAAVLGCFLAMLFPQEFVEALGGSALAMRYQEELFDTGNIMQVDILMEEAEWEDMLANASAEKYYSCNVVINGQQVNHVGIRPKGNTSLSAVVQDPDSDRYSLKLEFDHYIDGQTCLGLDKLVLNNNFADATNMKEAVVYDMYQYLGADASLYNYAEISVNGVYWGVYLALEAVEDSFLLRNYGAEDGALYKPENMGGGGSFDGADFGFRNGIRRETMPGDGETEVSGFPGGGGNSEFAPPEDVGGNGFTPPGDVGNNGAGLPGGGGNSGITSPEDEQSSGALPEEGETAVSGFPGGGGSNGFTPPGDVGNNGAGFPGRGGSGEFAPPEDLGGSGFTPPGDVENNGAGFPGSGVRGGITSPEDEQSSGALPEEGETAVSGFPGREGSGGERMWGGRGPSMAGNGSDLNYTDDNLDSYSAIWEGEVKDTGKSGHRRVVNALQHISEGTELETYLDIDNVLKYMAAHTFAVNMDSLSGNMAHNYYLYEYNGKLNIIPWDYNLSFGGMSMGAAGSAAEMVNYAIDTPFQGTEFFDALLEDEGYLSRYHEYMRMLAEEYVLGGRFEEVYSRIRSQIDALVKTDPTAFYSYEEYDAGAGMLRQTVLLRAESILGQLEGTIPSTEAGQRSSPSGLVDASAIDIDTMGVFNMGGQRFQFNGVEVSFSEDKSEAAQESVDPDPEEAPEESGRETGMEENPGQGDAVGLGDRQGNGEEGMPGSWPKENAIPAMNGDLPPGFKGVGAGMPGTPESAGGRDTAVQAAIIYAASLGVSLIALIGVKRYRRISRRYCIRPFPVVPGKDKNKKNK